MARHCPTCNRSSDDTRFFGEFCEHCVIEKLGNKIPEELKIIVCKRCGRVRLGNEFMDRDDSVLEAILAKGFKGWDVKLISSIEGAAIVDLSRPEDHIDAIRKEIKLFYGRQLCPKCNRRAASYYEGIIQLRGDPERIQKMMLKLEKVFEANDEFFSKVESTQNGINIFVSSKKLTSAFMSERGLKPTMSYELYGLKHGKKLYRNTYALHLD
ncbi:MAG: hypothetical protein KGH71_05915 [Candidatus Micrarchaeota archaeon]|nr:hypothetical protein [Candidatus Micrarchaeota archaeon]